MTDLFLKIQKHTFLLSVFSGIFLGFSLAYLVSILLISILEPDIATAAKLMQQNTVVRTKPRPQIIGIEVFQNMVAGNFLRDSVKTRGSNLPVSDDPGGGEIMLFGVISGSPSFATAAVQVIGESDVNEYRIGKTVAGYKILAIHYDGISIKRGSNRFKLKIGEKTSDRVTAAASTGAPSVPGAQKINISRDRLVAISQNQEELYKNKFAPITKNGKVEGFKLLYVPQNNFLYQLGARTGDIIRRFNGQPLESSEKMFEMWVSLKSADKVLIELERGGKILPFEIQIQN